MHALTNTLCSTYNFPIQLTLGPLIGAIAAGCTAVLKPSEAAPAAAAVVQRIVESALDPLAYSVVQGAIPETTALLDEKWDKIFYTGGQGVAKIISKKAAETLTPVTLELGGKNPAIVTKNANMHLAARRLAWAKTVNVGQVCISQNYIMVDAEMVPTFVKEFKAALDEFFPNGARASADYGRIVNDRSFQRLKKMLDSSSGKILLGGKMVEAERFMEPTVVQVSDPSDSLLTDESFGPLIPILPVKDLDTAIRYANEISVTPLGIYPFGSKAETDRVLRETRSGGATVNDGYYHGSIPTLPFGGVGESGQGAYRGRASFDCFTHRRTVVSTPNWMDALLAVRWVLDRAPITTSRLRLTSKTRYPPFEGTSKLKQFKGMSEMTPNFDRQGRVRYGILRHIITLGGVSASSGFTRWLMVLLCTCFESFLESKSRD